MLHWFVNGILPGLITSAIAIFGFNTLQVRLLRRFFKSDLREQTRELKEHISGGGPGDGSPGGSDPGPD